MTSDYWQKLYQCHLMSNEIKNILIYTDGACSGNPGPGGFGSIVTDFSKIIEIGWAVSQTTNNRMEMQAVITALRLVQTDFMPASQLQIFTDSVYVIRGATQWILGWKKRSWKTADNKEVINQDLWRELDSVLHEVQSKNNLKIQWRFIRGHKGIPGNERCDEIGVSFSKGYPISLYSGSLKNYYFDICQLPDEEPLPEMKSLQKETSVKKTIWYLSLINNKIHRYQSWKECESAVKGRAGVKFKKVTSKEEEILILKSWGYSSVSI